MSPPSDGGETYAQRSASTRHQTRMPPPFPKRADGGAAAAMIVSWRRGLGRSNGWIESPSLTPRYWVGDGGGRVAVRWSSRFKIALCSLYADESPFTMLWKPTVTGECNRLRAFLDDSQRGHVQRGVHAPGERRREAGK